jgi:hypothetical protein
MIQKSLIGLAKIYLFKEKSVDVDEIANHH